MSSEVHKNRLREAWGLRNQEKYDHARQIVHTVLQDLDQYDFMNQGYAWHVLMQIELDGGQIDKAIDFCEKSLLAYLKGNIPVKIGHALRHFGQIYRLAGKYITAEVYLRMALQQYQFDNSTPEMYLANTYRELGLTFEATGDEVFAQKYWFSAGEIYSRNGIVEGVTEVNSHLNKLQSGSSADYQKN